MLLLVAIASALVPGCRRSKPVSDGRDKAKNGAASADPRTEPPLAYALPEPGTPDVAAPLDPAAAHGGVLRVHLDAEPPHLDPLADASPVIGRVVDGLVYQTLVTCGRSGYRPALAESWETSPDGLRVSLRLRSGVRWHDGRAFGPTDVQATFERVLRSKALPVLRGMLADVEALEMLPDRSVRLRLLRPSGLALRALCELPILPEPALRGGTAALAALARSPVGTGPFKLAGWERGRRIRLQRVAASAGAPYVDEVSFEIEGDGVRALTRVRRGDLDVLPRVLDVHYPDQVSGPAVRDLVLYRLTPDRHSFLQINHAKEPLSDVRFRRALTLLWERDRLADEVRRGLVRPIGAPPFGAVPPPPYDPKAAASALDAAGYVDGNGDGVRDRAGTAIRLSVLVPAGAKAAAAELKSFALSLRRVGLLLDLVTVDAQTLLARVDKGDFDLAPFLWDGRPDEDARLLFAQGGPYARYHSDRVVTLLDELRLAPDPAARLPILQRLATTLADDVAALFLYRHDVPALVSRRVRGLAAAGDRLDLSGVWLAP